MFKALKRMRESRAEAEKSIEREKESSNNLRAASDQNQIAVLNLLKKLDEQPA